MHELSVCQAMLQSVRQIALENRTGAVSRIEVAVGPLSGIVPELLQQAFSLARDRSVAKDATLEITSLPVIISCSRCNKTASVPPNRLVCPDCGNFRTRLLGGDELVLRRVILHTTTGAGKSNLRKEAENV